MAAVNQFLDQCAAVHAALELPAGCHMGPLLSEELYQNDFCASYFMGPDGLRHCMVVMNTAGIALVAARKVILFQPWDDPEGIAQIQRRLAHIASPREV